MRRALVIRHVPREGVAGFRKPLEAAGYRLDQVDVGDAGFSAVDLDAPDLLVMMGGPMGVYERDAFPWIACQLRRLRRRLEAGLPTLGVCLGAQMIAAALGAKVFAGPRKEVGFHPLELSLVAGSNPLAALAGVPLLHWHGDSFDMPAVAERLASTPFYRNQAFRVGPNILALQFHAEMGLDPVFHEWVAAWPEFVADAGSTAEALRTAHERHGRRAVAAGQVMLAGWLAGLDARTAEARAA